MAIGHRERPVRFDELYFLGDTHRYIQISDQLQLSRVDHPASARQCPFQPQNGQIDAPSEKCFDRCRVVNM